MDVHNWGYCQVIIILWIVLNSADHYKKLIQTHIEYQDNFSTNFKRGICFFSVAVIDGCIALTLYYGGFFK
jgi:hypothetical protein